jgi:hypothetical protein
MLAKVGLIIGGLVTLGTLSYCAIDAIGDARETTIENKFNKDRVEDLKKRLGTDVAVKELERRLKIWCAAGVAECCRPDGGKLLQCTKDPSE